ncbi:MAG TPA: BNR-4 repeat-containing protein, partial [bacterium]|nr:BNR-4 repeat-containing protein [bacterium]
MINLAGDMNRKLKTIYFWLAILLSVSLLIGCGAVSDESEPFVLSTDGGWCWFEDPRAIIHNGKLIVGTVAMGRYDSLRAGDIEAIIYGLESEEITRVELYDRLQPDDHDSPVFLVRPDGRYLTLFAKHGDENHFYYRISEPGDPTQWGEIRRYTPSESTRLTYSNLYLLANENNRMYDLFRGLDDSYKPSYVYSDDLGETWSTGNVFIDVPATRRHRPYVRYTSNGTDEVHMIYTEGHPRVYDNSIYHIYYKDGMLHRSDGTPIRSLDAGLNRPEEGTLVFRGDSNHVAWTVDVELDDRGYPYAAYSVQIGGAGIPYGEGGEDIRYRYARWDGSRWHDYPLAYAGTRLYAGEDDYSGLVALDPDNPDALFISTDADPVTGEPLISETDGQRHYEIYKGVTSDEGASWNWTAVTQNSSEDNLRPIVPKWTKEQTFLLWLRGEYRAYTDYSL